MTTSFTEILSEGMGESVEFYMTDDTAPPKQYYGAFELNGEQYGMSFVQTTTARHFTFEFYRIANKNKKYWDIRKGSDWNVIVPTVMRFLEMVYTMSKVHCDSIIIKVPDIPKISSRQKFLERIIRKSFVKTMTYVPVQRLTQQKFTHIYLVKKGVDPKSIFNGAVFKKHFSFDVADAPIANLVNDEHLEAVAEPYKRQPIQPSLRPTKMVFGKFSIDTDAAQVGEIGSEIDTVTAALMDPNNLKVLDTLEKINSKDTTHPEFNEPKITKNVSVSTANVKNLSATDALKTMHKSISYMVREYVAIIIAAKNDNEGDLLFKVNDAQGWFDLIKNGRFRFGREVINGISDALEEAKWYQEYEFIKHAVTGVKYFPISHLAYNNNKSEIEEWLTTYKGADLLEAFKNSIKTYDLSVYGSLKSVSVNTYYNSYSMSHSPVAFCRMMMRWELPVFRNMFYDAVNQHPDDPSGAAAMIGKLLTTYIKNYAFTALPKGNEITKNIFYNVVKSLGENMSHEKSTDSIISEAVNRFTNVLWNMGHLDSHNDIDALFDEIKSKESPIFDPTSIEPTLEMPVPKKNILDMEKEKVGAGEGKFSILEAVGSFTEQEANSVAHLYASVLLCKMSNVPVDKLNTYTDALGFDTEASAEYSVHAYEALYRAIKVNGFLNNNEVIKAVFDKVTLGQNTIQPSTKFDLVWEKTNLAESLNAFSALTGIKGTLDYSALREVSEEIPFETHKGGMVSLFLSQLKFTDSIKNAEPFNGEYLELSDVMAEFEKTQVYRISSYVDYIYSYDPVALNYWGVVMREILDGGGVLNATALKTELLNLIRSFFNSKNVWGKFFISKEGNQNFIVALDKLPNKEVIPFGIVGFPPPNYKIGNDLGSTEGVDGNAPEVKVITPQGYLEDKLINANLGESDKITKGLAAACALKLAFDTLGGKDYLVGNVNETGQSQSIINAMSDMRDIKLYLDGIHGVVTGESKVSLVVRLGGNASGINIFNSYEAFVDEFLPVDITWNDIGEFVEKQICKTDIAQTPSFTVWSNYGLKDSNSETFKRLSTSIILGSMTMFLNNIKNGIDIDKLKKGYEHVLIRAEHAYGVLEKNNPFMARYITNLKNQSVGSGIAMKNAISDAFIAFCQERVKYGNAAQAIFEAHLMLSKLMVFGESGSNVYHTPMVAGKEEDVKVGTSEHQTKHVAGSALTADINSVLGVDAENPFSVDNDTSAVYGVLGFVPNMPLEKIKKSLEVKRSFLKGFPVISKAIKSLEYADKKPGGELYSYTGSSYKTYNGKMRAIIDDPKNKKAIENGERVEIPNGVKELVKDFDDVCVTIDKPFWVYRNTTIEGIDKYKVGDDLIDFGFMSTTISPIMSMGAGAGPHSVRLKIFIPAGTKFVPVIGVGQNSSEDEIILPPLSANRITEIVHVPKRVSGKFSITCLYAGTAYKSAFKVDALGLKESLFDLKNVASISEVRSLIEAKVNEKGKTSSLEDDFGKIPDYDDKWGPSHGDSRKIAEWLRKLKDNKPQK